MNPPITDRKGKRRHLPVQSAFSRLPREIIQQIMYMCDPNTFDSLTLVNSAWYHASRSVYLYAHHLQTCGIDTSLTLDETPEALSSLLYQFGLESRRGLFETMLRPQVTEIELICNSLSSSGAVPGGEVFRYDFSPRGNFLLAISSSRIIVIDLSTPSPDSLVTIKRELKIARRPTSTAILDDGSIMAVLSSEHRVSLYDLRGEKVMYMRSVDLENAPRTVALSPGAAVLAVAYDGGIEVLSLMAEYSTMTQSRAVKCEAVDALSFSLDGTVLMGSTLNSSNPVTVIISAPFLSQDLPISELLSQMWTTQILFPRSSRDNSHAALLPHYGENSSWTFTYDKVFAAFRAVLVDDLRNGHTYFAAPAITTLPPTSLPAPSINGGIVAAGFGNKSIFVYGVPSNLESAGDVNDSGTGNSTPHPHNPSDGRSHWQHIPSERLRNNFVHGRKIGDLEGLVGMKFTRSSKGERLVAVAAGLNKQPVDEDDDAPALGGGRLVFYDFGRGPRIGKKSVLTIEVGDGSYQPLEKLEEREEDIDAEVSIARRRTVLKRQRGHRASAGSTLNSSIGSSRGLDLPPVPTIEFGMLASRSTPSLLTSASLLNSRITSLELDEGDGTEEGSDNATPREAIDLPYSQTDPRSQNLLHRAATAAAANAAHTPRRRPDAEPQQSASVTNYRLLGLREEVWVEPPPLYTESLEKTALYDYEARLIERAANLGIMNPNTRLNVLERSHTSPMMETGQHTLQDMVSDSPISNASMLNRSPSLQRPNAPALRITSPISPVSSTLRRTGSVSRNGSISAGATTVLNTFPASVAQPQAPPPSSQSRRQPYYPPPDANVRIVADQDLPPVPSYHMPSSTQRREQERRRENHRRESQNRNELSSRAQNGSYGYGNNFSPNPVMSSNSRNNEQPPLGILNSTSSLSGQNNTSNLSHGGINNFSGGSNVSPPIEDGRVSPPLDRPNRYSQPMLQRLPSHRVARRTDTFSQPSSGALDTPQHMRNGSRSNSQTLSTIPADDEARRRSNSSSSRLVPSQFQTSPLLPQSQFQSHSENLSSENIRNTGSSHSHHSFGQQSNSSYGQQSSTSQGHHHSVQSQQLDRVQPPNTSQPDYSPYRPPTHQAQILPQPHIHAQNPAQARNVTSPTPSNYPSVPSFTQQSPQPITPNNQTSRPSRRHRNHDDTSSSYVNPQFMDTAQPAMPPMPMFTPNQPMQHVHPLPSPGRQPSTNRRTGAFGVGRKPSRAKRSAAQNVQDARMKKMAKENKKYAADGEGKGKGMCAIC